MFSKADFLRFSTLTEESELPDKPHSGTIAPPTGQSHTLTIITSQSLHTLDFTNLHQIQSSPYLDQGIMETSDFHTDVPKQEVMCISVTVWCIQTRLCICKRVCVKCPLEGALIHKLRNLLLICEHLTCFDDSLRVPQEHHLIFWDLTERVLTSVDGV